VARRLRSTAEETPEVVRRSKSLAEDGVGDVIVVEDLGSVACGKGSEYSKLDSCHESFVDEDHEGSDVSSDSSDET